MRTFIIKKTILCLLSLGLLTNVAAQNANDLDSLITKSVTAIKQGQGSGGLSPFRHYIKPFPKEIYIKCTPLLNNENAKVRDFAYQLISVASYRAEDPNFRKSVASILVKGCKDKEAWLRKNIAERLEEYKFNEFSFSAKNKIKEILHMEKTYAQNVYLMTGFLQLKDQVRHLNKLLAECNPEHTSEIRNLRTALGRLGDKTQIDYLINMVKTSGKDLREDEFLFPLLIFTRSKKAIDYTFEEFSGSNKLLSARILDILAPIIKDFPIKVDETGDTDIDDYEVAIKQVKNWYRTNRESYVILTDSF